MNISIVGAGRAGSSFATALERVGHHVELVHHDDVSSIGDSSLVILCVPDDAISSVAASIAASVVMNESMVATFGQIIPTPFAMPPILTGTPPISNS